MKKRQTDRLRVEKIRGEGPKEIFGENAQKHDKSVNSFSALILEALKQEFPNLEFRFRKNISKKEINKKLNSVDERLGKVIFLENSKISPDGGIIEVKDKEGKWRIILVSEAKHQGKDIENITNGLLVGKKGDQIFMAAGNAIERSHKNINEIRNLMIDEKHFPYILFLQGSNFLTEEFIVIKPDGSEFKITHTNGTLNRLDRLTAANYSLPINQNNCENIFINIDGNSVMLQAVSIYAKPLEWTFEEVEPIMLNVAKVSLKILNLIK